jgi:DNA-binding NarL/FixJ family response regulator
MARTCCLAGIASDKVALISAALKDAGAPALATVARLNVTELGRLAPGLLVCDIDGLATDQFELLRQLRFVMPDCVVAVYTDEMRLGWVVSCHLAGANAVLSKHSTETQLSSGLRGVQVRGCYTDPRFVAA